MKEKTLVNVVINVILLSVIVFVSCVGLVGDTVDVFSEGVSPIYSGKAENAVSLMINVYQGNEYIDELLAIFKRHDVTVTFFVGGCWAAKNPEMLATMAAAGHEIGNHGYWHKDQKNLSLSDNVAEINACHKTVLSTIGVDMKLFAPPSGSFSKKTLQAAQEQGYLTIMWSRDTIDWRDQNAELIFTRATKGVKAGDLILMHPTKATVAAMEKIMQFYISNDIKVVTVSKNIS